MPAKLCLTRFAKRSAAGDNGSFFRVYKAIGFFTSTSCTNTLATSFRAVKVVPGGALSNASALGKGLLELKSLGFIDKLPRVAVVQADGANPFHRMVQNGSDKLIAQTSPNTRASALNIGNPPSWKKALRTLEATNGLTVSVSDDEIMEAKALIDRSGIGCEPASAAAVAGLRKLVGQQTVDRDATALCILTGHLLKDTNALYDYHCKDAGANRYGNPIIAGELALENILPYC